MLGAQLAAARARAELAASSMQLPPSMQVPSTALHEEEVLEELKDKIYDLPTDVKVACCIDSIVHSERRVRRAAVSLLQSFPKNVLDESSASRIVGFLEDAHHEWGVRSSCLAILAAHPSHALAVNGPRFAAMLCHAEWRFRAVGLEALNLLDDDAIRPLCATLITALPGLEWDLQQVRRHLPCSSRLFFARG